MNAEQIRNAATKHIQSINQQLFDDAGRKELNVDTLSDLEFVNRVLRFLLICDLRERDRSGRDIFMHAAAIIAVEAERERHDLNPS